MPSKQSDQATAASNRVAEKLGGTVKTETRIAILSVTGVGIRSHTGVGLRMFRALTEKNINMRLVSTSEVKVNVVIDGTQGQTGLTAIEAAFEDVIG